MYDTEALRFAADRAIEFAATIDDRPATPTVEAIAALAAFDEPLPDSPTDAGETIRKVAELIYLPTAELLRLRHEVEEQSRASQ